MGGGIYVCGVGRTDSDSRSTACSARSSLSRSQAIRSSTGGASSVRRRKRRCGSAMLSITEDRVNEQPISAETSDISVHESGACWTTSALNPAALLICRSLSSSSVPVWGCSDTNGSPSNCAIDTASASAAVGLRDGDDQFLDGDHAGAHDGGNVIPSAECDIDVATGQQLHRRLGEVLTEQFEVDARVVLVDGAGELSDHHVGGRARIRQPDVADLARSGRPGDSAHPIQGVQHLLGGCDQRLSDGGQRDLASAPFEQSRAQSPLQLLDAAADRRLRHVEALCGAPEMQFIGDSEEGAQLLQIHPKIIARPVLNRCRLTRNRDGSAGDMQIPRPTGDHCAV